VKLKVFTPEQWAKYKAKQNKKWTKVNEADRHDAHNRGMSEQLDHDQNLIAAALFSQLAREPGQVELTVTVEKSLLGSVKLLGIKYEGGRVYLHMAVASMLPD